MMTPEQAKAKLDEAAGLIHEAVILLTQAQAVMTRTDDKMKAKETLTDLGWAVENCAVMGYHQIGQCLNDLMGYTPGEITEAELDEQEEDDFKPDWYSPPGATIHCLAKQIGINKEKLAELLDIKLDDLEALLIGHRSIKPRLAQRLASYLGMNADFWLRLEKRYRKEKRRLMKLKG